MKITLFTSNKLRHAYLINLLGKICDELFVVQESKTEASDARFNHAETGLIKKYFKDFLEYISIDEKLFWKSVDNFRSPHLWERKEAK